MWALWSAAASMRELPRHRRPVRPLLRVLRPRACARRGAAHLVAPVAAGRAGATGGGAVGWNLVGPNAPDQIDPNHISLPPSGGRARGEGRDNRQRSGAVQTLAAFDAKAVPAEVVMPARGAHQPARWVGLQPALALAPIPDPILRAEHPPSALAVEDRKVTYGKPERPGLEPAVATLFDEHSIASLGIRKRVDRHAKSMSGLSTPRQRSGRGGCRIP